MLGSSHPGKVSVGQILAAWSRQLPINPHSSPSMPRLHQGCLISYPPTPHPQVQAIMQCALFAHFSISCKVPLALICLSICTQAELVCTWWDQMWSHWALGLQGAAPWPHQSLGTPPSAAFMWQQGKLWAPQQCWAELEPFLRLLSVKRRENAQASQRHWAWLNPSESQGEGAAMVAPSCWCS